jgi:hypothetical protein
MSTKRFEEVMEGIEDTDMDAFKEVWNAAIETCSTIAHDCIEFKIADECNDYKVD